MHPDKLGRGEIVAGIILIMAGGAYRAGSAERPRKPPGVL